MNECDLAEQIVFRQPLYLSFTYMCIASYPGIVFSAPLTDRNHRLAAIRLEMVLAAVKSTGP